MSANNVPNLDVNNFLSRAEAETGLSDWGPGLFKEHLTEMVADVRHAELNDAGLRNFENRVARTLRNRLLLVESRRADPRIAAQKITRPIFITGFPRSGTTFLHSLLAQDPASRSPAEWEAVRPCPPPRTATYRSDERIVLAAAEMSKNPVWNQMHINGAQLPVECGPTGLVYEFDTSGFNIRFNTPTLEARLEGGINSGFQWHKMVLQHLQVDTVQTHWVLKSPEHLGHLAEMFSVYPDALVVFTHRDPAQVIPSFASLTAFMQEENGCKVDRLAMGPQLADFWRRTVEKAQKVRDSQPDPKVFCDIKFRELRTRPMEIARKLYEQFEMELTPAAVASMEAWLVEYNAEKYTKKHGTHSYTAAEYGLSETALREQFHEYIKRYM